MSKVRQQIRKAPRTNYEDSGERLAMDFHDYEESLSNETSHLIFTCRNSGVSWDALEDRKTETIIHVLHAHIRWLEYQYDIKVKAIETDLVEEPRTPLAGVSREVHVVHPGCRVLLQCGAAEAENSHFASSAPSEVMANITSKGHQHGVPQSPPREGPKGRRSGAQKLSNVIRHLCGVALYDRRRGWRVSVTLPG